MTFKTLAAAAVLGVVAFVPAALAADDPLAAVKTDIAKLQTDFSSAHDTLIADAQKLQADAALIKPGNKDAAKAALTADWAQLKSDFAAKHTVMQADWTQLHADFEAARAAKSGTKDDRAALRDAAKQMHDAFQTGRAQVHEAVQAARAAIEAARKAGAPISKGDANKVSDGGVVPAATP
jgi:cobalamin-dependent methionine synthase I